MFVCLCKSITDHQIRDAVEEGVTSFESMQAHLSVSTQCGSCACEVKDIMEDKLRKTLGGRGMVNSGSAVEVFL